MGGDRLTKENLVEQIAPYVGTLRAFIAPQIPKRFSALVDVDDVIQITWTNVLQSYDSFEYRGEQALRNWLFTIAESRLNDELTRLTALKRGGGAKTLRPADGPSGLATNLLADICGADRPASWIARWSEMCNLVDLAVKSMLREERECLALRYGSGMTYREIASELQIPESRVRTMLQQSLTALRTRLGTVGDLLKED